MKLLILKLLSRLPTPLPVGMTEFNRWSDSIIELSGKYADPDSLKFALASMIMHLDSKKAAMPKAYFVRCLRKVAANQVAGQVFQDIKIRQQEALVKAAAEQSEATASNEVADESKERAQ